MTMKVPELGIRFLDTLNFLPMALSKLTGCFDLKVRKGYFPHKKNTRTLYEADKVEDYPDLDYFEPDYMSADMRQKVIQWVEEQKAAGAKFHLKSDLLKYCRDDVSLLRYARVFFPLYFWVE